MLKICNDQAWQQSFSHEAAVDIERHMLEQAGSVVDPEDSAAEFVAASHDRTSGAGLTMPLAGRSLPELSRHDIREVLVRSYRIVYRVSAPTTSAS